MSGPLTLGTAGHIDHGKTVIVGALTGVDTDRLPEEKARGISIALGYAPLALPGGRRVSVVDVPGHERFVRTMVAGATGIDFFLMVVAADDGVMPQTREHAAVLDALGVSVGVVAVTKTDLVDPTRAASEAAELMPPGTAVVACSGRTGAGLAELRAALAAAAERVTSRAADGPVVLHVDRVFTVRGAGTVVTGTLWSGSVATGDRLLVWPAGDRVRVRSVHVHDERVESASAGQRVALNVPGARVQRGDVIGDGVAVTYRLDVAGPREVPSPVIVHHGTRETPARAVRLGDDRWQLRLARPLLAREGDRVVLRTVAPPDTIGGGVVLDPSPRRHGPNTPQQRDVSRFDVAGERQIETRPAVAASPSPAAVELEERLRAAGLDFVSDVDTAVAAELRDGGRAVRVGRSMWAHPDAVASATATVRDVIEREGSITLARLRDELHTSRRIAQALLEHLDATRVTLRLPDDSRRLRSRARRP